MGCHSLLQGIFLTRIKPQSPTLQADSLPSEPPGTPSRVQLALWELREPQTHEWLVGIDFLGHPTPHPN